MQCLEILFRKVWHTDAWRAAEQRGELWPRDLIIIYFILNRPGAHLYRSFSLGIYRQWGVFAEPKPFLKQKSMKYKRKIKKHIFPIRNLCHFNTNVLCLLKQSYYYTFTSCESDLDGVALQYNRASFNVFCTCVLI